MSGKPLLETLLHKRGNDLFGLPEVRPDLIVEFKTEL